jgi:flagellar basal-body rod protein FlgB
MKNLNKINMRKILAIFLTMVESTGYSHTVNDLNDQLKYMAARELILSQNLANIDTPGYKPQDIKKRSSPSESIGLKVTHKGHMTIDQNLDYDLVAGDIIEIKPNGNAVTAEHELAKKNENAIEFSKTSNIVNSVRSMTKTAVSGGK